MSPTNASARPRRRRGSIGAADIVAGAFEVARRDTLERLSMPALASHLDVGVTSIYWYFHRKSDLLNAMTDVAIDEFVGALQPTKGLTWQAMLRQHCMQTRTIFLSDPTLCDLVLIRTSNYSREATRRAFEPVEDIVADLIAAGFTSENAFRVYSTASVFTRGAVILDQVLHQSDAPTLDDRQQRMIDWSGMPHLDALVRTYSLAGTDDAGFEFGLDLIIKGGEATLAEQRGSRSAARRRS